MPTTVQQFLDDHPVPAYDLVHVEDGAWFNAANDWGHPQFINWFWPLFDNSTYTFDPNGWTEDARNWAVLTAGENHVQMAEDLSEPVDVADLGEPSASSSMAEGLGFRFQAARAATCTTARRLTWRSNKPWP